MKYVFPFLIMILAIGSTCMAGTSARPAPPAAGKPDLDQVVSLPSPKFQQVLKDLNMGMGGGFILDRDGFAWFGGLQGLIKWDGRRTYTFTPWNSKLTSSFITSLLEDRDGIIWVATGGGGLNRYDKDTGIFTHYRHESGNPGSLSGDTLGSNMSSQILAEDPAGYLWAGTMDKGVNRLDKKSGEMTRYLHDPDDPRSLSSDTVFVVAATRSGDVWVGTDHGLNRFDLASGGFVRFIHDPANPRSLASNQVRAIFEDRSGRLLIGTFDGGLQRFEPGTGDFSTFLRAGVREDKGFPGISSIAEDAAGYLWLTHHMDKITIYQRETGVFRHVYASENKAFGLRGVNIKAVYADRTGAMWVTSQAGEVSRHDPAAFRFELYTSEPDNIHSLPANDVGRLFVDSRNTVWGSCFGTGAFLFDPATDKFTRLQFPGSGQYAFLEDRSGSIWFAGDTPDLKATALYQIDRNTLRPGRRIIIPGARIQDTLVEDKINPDILWFSTGNSGLGQYNKRTGRFRFFSHDPQNPASISANSVWFLIIDQADPHILWMMAYPAGLERFDSRTGTFTHFSHDENNPESLAGNNIGSLLQTKSGGLWVAVIDSGLDKMNKAKGTFEHHSAANHRFPAEPPINIMEDEDGYFWVGGTGTIIRYDPRTYQWVFYREGDGVQPGINWSGVTGQDSTGRMWFGGSRGLNSFHPRQIKKNEFRPPVFITALAQGGEPFKIGMAPERIHDLQLDWRNNFFEFEAAALDFTHPEQNHYRYKLEGWDTGWYNAGTLNRGRYSGLPGGGYVLRIGGTNSDGEWSNQEAVLRVTVSLPWWQTAWAKSFYLLFAIGLVAGVFVARNRVHNRKLAQKEAELARERQVSERLQHLDRLKDEFLANTSHELRTPLHAIIGLAESLRDGAAGPLPADAGRNLQMVVSSGKRLSRLVDDILDFSKLKHHEINLHLRPVDVSAVVSATLSMLEPLIGRKNLRLCNDIPAEGVMVLADENRLQQILFNLLGNAIKFTGQGIISVQAGMLPEGMAAVSVHDTGIGIPPEKQALIFESFVQADGSIERTYGGTGLGLTVTRQLVELHGGTIRVQSVPGEGSVFTFTLPAAPACEAAAGDGKPSAGEHWQGLLQEEGVLSGQVPEEVQKTGRGHGHILVVDDELVNLQVLNNFLGLRGYAVSLCQSGMEALELLENGTRPDLILLDIMMPRMSGYEVSRKIRHRYPLQELPILMVTAKHLTSDLVAGFLAGANDYLVKPFDKEELFIRVETLIKLKDYEQALRESELRYRTLFESAPVGILVSTYEGQAIVSNTHLLELLNMPSREDLVRFNLRNAYRDPAERVALMEKLRHDGIVREYETKLKGAGESYTDVIMTMNRIVYAGEETILTVIQDITWRKQAEEELRRAHDDLELRVRERTLQLEMANKELESFSYSVSHDLRAPLRAINGYARILEEDFGGRLDEEGHKVVEVICREANTMGQLIDGLLHFSRLGRQPLKISTVDLARLVAEVFQKLRQEDPRRHIEWHLAPLSPAMGDPVLLKQVWMNLLDNALKFTRGTEPAVIEAGESRQGEETVYYVRDNGAGFDMQYADKLFGVFQRLHSQEEFEGTGVGLALVHRIVSRHGGRVWAEGSPGNGAVFYFTLKTMPPAAGNDRSGQVPE